MIRTPDDVPVLVVDGPQRGRVFHISPTHRVVVLPDGPTSPAAIYSGHRYDRAIATSSYHMVPATIAGRHIQTLVRDPEAARNAGYLNVLSALLIAAGMKE